MSFVGRASGALLTTGLAATLSIGSVWSAQALQSTLADQARATLESRHLVATVQMSGRDATVWAATSSAREQAIDALLSVPGVRIVVAGEGDAPSNSTAGATVTVSSSATAQPTVSASASASVEVSSSPSVTPTLTSVPSVSTSPSASATATASTTTPKPAPTTVTIPTWPAIQFSGGDAALDATDKAELHQISTFMLANAGIKVTLTGHTDSGRSEAERLALGLARAKAAAAVLTADGVQAIRITTLSMGAKDPVASNTTAQGRAQNRRVTVSMTPGS